MDAENCGRTAAASRPSMMLLPLHCCCRLLDLAPVMAEAMDGSAATPLGSVRPVPLVACLGRLLLPGGVLLGPDGGSGQRLTLLLLSIPPADAAGDVTRLLCGAPGKGWVWAPRTTGPCLLGVLLVTLASLMLLTMLLVLSLRRCTVWLGRLWERLLRLVPRPRRPVRSARSCSASCTRESGTHRLGRTPWPQALTCDNATAQRW